MEEQTSGTIAVKKSKWPSKHGLEGPSYSPKYFELSYGQFGGQLEQSNLPHLHRATLILGQWQMCKVGNEERLYFGDVLRCFFGSIHFSDAHMTLRRSSFQK